MKRTKGILVLLVLIAIWFTVPADLAFADSNQLRAWVLGSAGSPSANWGEKDCKVWGQIYKDCKHPGVDYGTGGKKVKVYSVCDGQVVAIGGNLGKVCIYNPKSSDTFIYLHLSSIAVKNGKVAKGQVIGLTGNTAPWKIPVHLHFEARRGKQTNAAASYSGTINPYQAASQAR